MPLYEFQCTKCGHVFEEFLSVSNRHMPVSQACPSCEESGNIVSVLGTPPIADPVRLGRIRAPESFRDLLRHIKSRNAGSTLDIN